MKAAITFGLMLLALAGSNAKPAPWFPDIEEIPQCGQNERFTFCGSACPATCDDVRNPNYHKQCTMQCVIGCQCEPGYVLNEQNQCVMKSHCPIIPGPSLEEVLNRLAQQGLPVY